MSVFGILFEDDLFLIKRYGPGVKDALGRTTRALLSSTLADGLLAQTGTAEGEAFVVDEFRATMPLGTDLRASDEVESGGKLYTVKGSPFSSHAPGMKSVGVVTAILKYVGPVT
jgi:hypothetical protein